MTQLKNTPFALIIMDGFGLSKKTEGNAILNAKKPNLDKYFSTCPFSNLDASGESVGVSKGMQGSSEVGHMNMGAGRIVLMDQEKINQTIKNKSFQKNEAFLMAIQNCKTHGTNLHIMGLLQDQGVHALQTHLFELIKLCAQNKIIPLLHIFTDGRDTLPKSTETYFAELEKVIEKYPAKIVTITGRYYAMDRDKRWDRTQLAYEAIRFGHGDKLTSWQQAIKYAYKLGETDEFIKPIILNDYHGLKENDSLIFFNYRSDRARQITRAFIDPEFKDFPIQRIKLLFVSMTEYYANMQCDTAFKREFEKNILSKVLEDNQIKQLRIAETEKYAHVTFFFNDQIEEPFKYEDRILIPSPKVATYDLKPEMSAFEIRDAVLKDLNESKHQVYIMNFANCDMVGHTGKYDAAVKAVETVDSCIGSIVDEIKKKNGAVIIVADHGNAEVMTEPDGSPNTAHTTNKVPCCLIGSQFTKIENGKLADLAPTILKILGLKIPKEMTGKVLV